MKTTDFLENQRTAVQRTGLLLTSFVVPVVLSVIHLYFLAIVVCLLFKNDLSLFLDLASYRRPMILLYVIGVVLLMFLVRFLYMLVLLRSGGRSVVEMMGGVPVRPGTKDPLEIRFVHTVEEMALSSGIPTPRAYVQQFEPSINAFTAGLNQEDAVVCVSRGTLELLTRDELQGIVAHEFSHIISKDISLNFQLISILEGVESISFGGPNWLGIFEKERYEKTRHLSFSVDLVLVIFMSILCGLLGFYIAKVIRGAISREREFLADAAAVQYTRYAPGLAGALKKIGGLKIPPYINRRYAEKVSHLFFSDILNVEYVDFLGKWFSTHPNLVERIRRLEPGFDGRFPEIAPAELNDEEEICVPEMPPVKAVSCEVPEVFPPGKD